MRQHHPLRPCRAPGPRRPVFQVRPCRRSLRRRACCPVLHLVGELDVAAAPDLLVAVGRALDRRTGPPGPGLVLDLRALTFCDASGLTGLLRSRRLADAAGLPLYLTAPSPELSRIFLICDLQRAFPLHPAPRGLIAEQAVG